MPDIDNFAQLLDQLFDPHFGVIHLDSDARDVRHFALADGDGLSLGAATAQHPDDTINHARFVVCQYDQRMRTLGSLWSFCLACSLAVRRSGLVTVRLLFHDSFTPHFPRRSLRSCW